MALIPTPRNLATAQFSDRSLSESLWNGVRGSSMPSWSDLPSGELRGLVAYLKTIAPTEPPPDLTALERATGKAIYVNSVPSATARPGPATAQRRQAGPGPRPTSTRSGLRSDTPRRPRNGVQGSAMPKWGPKLTPAERHCWPATFGRFMGSRQRSNWIWPSISSSASSRS